MENKPLPYYKGKPVRSKAHYIIRFYRDEDKQTEIIGYFPSLVEARAYCSRPDTRKEGVWFDGYSDILPMGARISKRGRDKN